MHLQGKVCTAVDFNGHICEESKYRDFYDTM